MTGILNPLAILAIPVLAVLVVVIILQHQKRVTRGQRLGLTFSLSATRVVAISLIPCVLMVLALLRPYSGSTDVTLPSATRDYMFVVDVSRSMFTRDVPPSRMELTKRKLKDLIDEFARQGEPHRYGITLFAGYSYLLCPITDDAGVVKQFISEISPEMVTSLGSNLEAGINTALSRFNGIDGSNVRVLLVSDGEDDLLSLERIIKEVESRKIRVDVLGVGTPTGSPIELDDGSFIRDRAGSVVTSKLAESSLQAIAEAGSGTYVRATIDDRDIRELVRDSLSLHRGPTQGTRTVRTYQEFGSWLALAALAVILLIAGSPSAGSLVRVLVLLLLWSESAVASPLTSPQARSAYELYEAGEYDNAVTAFKAALDENPNDRALLQGYASALYKTKKFAEAQKIFSTLATQSTKGKDYFENTYNEGNALLAMNRYQDAVDAFNKALDVKPNDERAMHNRAVAKALLEQERNKPTPTPTPTPDPNQSPQPSPQASPQQQDNEKQNDKQKQQPEQNQQQQGQQSPQPSPSAAPSPQGPPSQGQATPSPQPSPSSAPNSQPSPSPEPQASPTEGTPSPNPQQREDDRLKENQTEEAPQPESQPAAPPMALDTRSPSEKEAEAWLESLPESPLLIRRERGHGKQGGQTW